MQYLLFVLSFILNNLLPDTDNAYHRKNLISDSGMIHSSIYNIPPSGNPLSIITDAHPEEYPRTVAINTPIPEVTLNVHTVIQNDHITRLTEKNVIESSVTE